MPSTRSSSVSSAFTAGSSSFCFFRDRFFSGFAFRTRASVSRTDQSLSAACRASSAMRRFDGAPSSARAWPAVSDPSSTSRRTLAGNCKSRNVLATVERSRPTASATSFCDRPNSSTSCW